MIVHSAGGPGFHFLWSYSAWLLRNRDLAIRFLDRFKKDPEGMTDLRRLLTQRTGQFNLSRVSDDQVMEEIARLLGCGELVVCVDRERALGGGGPEPEPEPAAVRAPAPRARQVKEKEEPEPATFPPEIDAAVMAASQQRAAELGVPFCEECARRALARSTT